MQLGSPLKGNVERLSIVLALISEQYHTGASTLEGDQQKKDLCSNHSLIVLVGSW